MRRDEGKPSSISFPAILLAVASFMTAAAFAMVTLHPSNAHLSAGTTSKLHSRTLSKNQTLHYPVFHDQQLDAIVGDYVSGEAKRFETETASRSDSHLTLTFQLAHYSDRVVTVSFSRSKQIAGQPDVNEVTSLILDRQQKRRLLTHDVIAQTPQARLALAQLIHDYFKMRPELGLSPADYVGILELPHDGVEVLRLESNTVVLRAPLKGGTVDVAISKQLLDGVLTPAYVDSAIDTLPVASMQTQFAILERPPRSINPHDKIIALTFDDGPGDLTPALLDALQAYEAQATFFVLGHLAETYKVTLQRMVREGHEIGNHTWNHPDLRLQSAPGRDHQIMATQHAIQAATGGYIPQQMRPPYGATTPELLHYLNERHLRQSLWTVDTQDWRDRDSELIYQRIMSSATDGQILLLHDIYPSSITAAIRAIRDLKLQGYQLVTMSQINQYR